MAIDIPRPLLAAIEAAVDEALANGHKKRRFGAAKGLLLGAGLVTAGRLVMGSRGRDMLQSLQQHLPERDESSRGNGGYEDEDYDDEAYEDEGPEGEADEDFDEEPEDEADENLDEEPEDEADEDLDEEPDGEADEDLDEDLDEEPEGEPDDHERHRR